MDERDLEIEQHSKQRGLEVAWWFLVLTLIAMLILLGKPDHAGFVSKTVLNWLIWLQFAAFFGVKGIVSIIQYRKQVRVS